MAGCGEEGLGAQQAGDLSDTDAVGIRAIIDPDEDSPSSIRLISVLRRTDTARPILTIILDFACFGSSGATWFAHRSRADFCGQNYSSER